MSEELQELINAPPVIGPNKDLLESWLKEHASEPWVLAGDTAYTAMTWQLLHPIKSNIAFNFERHIMWLIAKKEQEQQEMMAKVAELVNSGGKEVTMQNVADIAQELGVALE